MILFKGNKTERRENGPVVTRNEFLSLGLAGILALLYFAMPKESDALAFSMSDRHLQSRYIVGPEIF